VSQVVKSDEVYAAEARLKDAERKLEEEIRYKRPEWKVSDARREVDAAKRILHEAQRRR
jgi:hypothetical protein